MSASTDLCTGWQGWDPAFKVFGIRPNPSILPHIHRKAAMHQRRALWWRSCGPMPRRQILDGMRSQTFASASDLNDYLDTRCRAESFHEVARAARLVGDRQTAAMAADLRRQLEGEADRLRLRTLMGPGEFAKGPDPVLPSGGYGARLEAPQGPDPRQEGSNVSAPRKLATAERESATGSPPAGGPGGSVDWLAVELPDRDGDGNERGHIARCLGTRAWFEGTVQALAELPRTEPGREKYRLQAIARRVFRSKSLRGCGVAAAGQDVDLAMGPRGHFVRGTLRCGSTAKCPVCAGRISAQRAARMTAALEACTSVGLQVTVLALTLRHDRGHQLVELFDAVQESWRRSQQGRAWVEGSKALDILGGWRVTEVTADRPHADDELFTRSQWHPHVHLVVVHGPGSTSAEVGEFVVSQWVNAVRLVGAQLGVERIDPDRQAQWHEPLRSTEAIAGYVTKVLGGALEHSGSWASKNAGRDRVNPGELLDLAARGVDRAIVQLREYEEATDGRRMWGVFGARKLAARLLDLEADPELLAIASASDEELAEVAEAVEAEAEASHCVPAYGWRLVCQVQAVAPVLAACDALWATRVAEAGDLLPPEHAERLVAVAALPLPSVSDALELLAAVDEACELLRQDPSGTTVLEARQLVRRAADRVRCGCRRSQRTRGPAHAGASV